LLAPHPDAKVFSTMSNEKRMVLTLVLTVASVWGLQELLVRTGVLPRQPIVDPAAEVAKEDPAKDKGKNKPKDAVKLADAAKPPGAKGDVLPKDVFAPDVSEDKDKEKNSAVLKPGPKLARPEELVLGSDEDDSPAGYHLRLQLDQRGATVLVATSAKYDAEFKENQPRNLGRNPRLKLIDTDPFSEAPGSLAMTLTSTAKAPRPISADPEDTTIEPPKVEAVLDVKLWEVVRDKDDAPAVRTVVRTHPTTKTKVEVQEIAFRYTADDPAVTVTKTYRLWKGEDGFEVELKFSSAKDSKFTYRLFGPHGIPIEGEWYTSTFRDVFFGGAKGNSTDITTRASTEVVKYNGDPSCRLSALPLKFAGVEDQYFATFLQPWPIPKSQEDRLDHDAAPVVFIEDPKAPQKSDVGVEINSRPLQVGPNLDVVHTYKVYAGPKLASALVPYEAEDLASYRKNQWVSIPYAVELAKYVISPLLDKIYSLTQAIAHLFGWKNGNYGIAIILLTMTVRLIMFPLGRKQAMMAKKMQDLQPVLAEVKEKFKDDKEALTRETMAVWKRHKINPAAGCIPALIQMPIFVGLWQSLNNSVALRHSPFLYIRDLAAPDMLFKFPMTIPLLGDYFNLLPFLVVALMLVQTKLFSPPPTTPEAEMNQKMMKYMMIFMAFMFYKVPSGLGLYFITSSTWQICERLMLPKVIANHAKPAVEGGDLPGDNGNGKGPGGNGNGNGKGPGGNANGNAPQGWLGRRLEKLLEEAAKDKTIRNSGKIVGDIGGDREREREREREPERNRPRPRPGKRR
jgi:YidC/Oxa1 family membrane protein insertase